MSQYPSHALPCQQQDEARDQLKKVETQLREERRIINRDWAQMTPRARSNQSRIVKALEARQRVLTEEIEMLGAI